MIERPNIVRKPDREFIVLDNWKVAQRLVRAGLNWFPGWSRQIAALAGLYLCIGYLVQNAFARIAPGEPKKAFWATLILFAVTLLLNEYARPKPKLENARPSGIGDFQIPTATEGRPIPVLWGRARVNAPNIIWYGDVKQDAVYTKVKTGLWSSKTFISGFKNYVAWQQGICRGGDATPVALHGAWIGDTKVYSSPVTTNTSFLIDEPDLYGGDVGTGGVQMEVEFYTGTTTQPVSTFLDTIERQRNQFAATQTAPRYSGTCHLVVRQIGAAAAVAGAYVGNTTTVKQLSVDVERIPALFSGQSGTQNKIGSDGDCNPINAIYELLTNTEWGFGVSPTLVDVGASSSFKAAADTCITEANGFSLLVDGELDGDALLKELERQVDGIVFRDLQTGKWTIKLARDDYDIDTCPLFDESNSSVVSYSQSTWEDTTNQVQLLFNKRDDDYKESYALAHDTANAQIRGGGTVNTALIEPVQVRFPGVKTAANASNLAWRELRTVGYPLKRATFKVNKAQWDLQLGQVIAWSSDRYDFTKVPMRVVMINDGALEDNAMTVTTVQSVFYFEDPSFAAPPATDWEPPVIELVAYPADEQVIIEAPRAIIVRDPVPGNTFLGAFALPGDPQPLHVGRSWYFLTAARQTNESGYRQYNIANLGGLTANPVQQFMGIGTLQTSLPRGEANPRGTIDVTTLPSFEDQFDNAISTTSLGTDLSHLIMIGNEFMLVHQASHSGGTLTLTNVYRGALDSVQEPHSIGDKVYFLFFGSDMARWPSLIAAYSGISVTIGLRATYGGDEYGGAITSVVVPNTTRASRPYPPGAPIYNGGSAFGTPSLEGAGSGLNGFRIDTTWWRRNFSTENEVATLTADDTLTSSSTEYRLEVRADPNGANTLVGSISAWTTGTGPLQVMRTDIITAAPAGTLLRFLIRARHDYTDSLGNSVTDRESRYDMAHDVTPTSGLTGQFYFNGASTVGLAANVASASYTALATGTYTLNIGAAQATANIQVSLNGGAFATVIAAGLTTGTFAVTAGDTIRVRRTVSEAPNPQFVELQNPSATSVAYGTFKS